MEVDKCKSKPKSLWAHLFQQVQEESVFCDVTVKVNSWSRKYHWCVLSTSPFFAKLYESKLKEQQTGIIHLNIGNSNSVEAAIHFLYGQRPQIDINNVESILETAEFFMVEELKALCIARLEFIRVDFENCLRLLLLTSRYNIYLKMLSDFILAHLPELLPREEMVLLDKESVRYIISDQMLAYVSREECLQFLVRWICHIKRRQSDFVELLACLDTDGISARIHDTVSMDRLSKNNRELLNSISSRPPKLYDFIITYRRRMNSGKTVLYGYNLVTKSWVQTLAADNFFSEMTSEIITSEQITLVKVARCKIMFYNLLTQISYYKTLEAIPKEDNITCLDKVAVNATKLYAVKHVADRVYNPYKRPVLELRAFVLYISESMSYDDVVCTEKTVRMKGVMSARGRVQSLCVNDKIIYLLLRRRKKQILVFVPEQHRIKYIDLTINAVDDGSYLCPCLYGGVYVVTKCHLLQVDILISSLDITANVYTYPIPRRAYSDCCRLSCYPRIDILRSIIIYTCGRGIGTKMSYQNLPSNVSLLEKEEKNEIELPNTMVCFRTGVQFLQAQLPREIIRCCLDCPHCIYDDKSKDFYAKYQAENLDAFGHYDTYMYDAFDETQE